MQYKISLEYVSKMDRQESKKRKNQVMMMMTRLSVQQNFNYIYRKRDECTSTTTTPERTNDKKSIVNFNIFDTRVEFVLFAQIIARQ